MHAVPLLQRILKRPGLLFLSCWLLVMLLYLPAWKAGFQQDFHGWLMMYTDLPFWDVINRKGAGIKSFYQLTQLQLYFWTWLFGIKPLPWFLLMTALHAWNGCLLRRFSERLFQDFKLPQAGKVALWGMLLFLISPAMTEAVVWKACYHYMIAMQIILWILIWAQEYLHSKNPRLIVYALGLFLLSTLTLELWFAIPWLVLVLDIGYRRAGFIAPSRFKGLLGSFFLPMLGIFIAYLCFYRIRYGMWLAHGAYEVTGDASVPIMAGRIWSYEAHLHLGARFWPHSIREFLYRHIAEGPIGWPLALIAILGFAVYAFIRFPKAGPGLRLTALFAAWALLMLGIILHYIPDELFLAANDRYLYATGMFQCMLVILLIALAFQIRASLQRIVLSLFILINIALTAALVWNWRQSAKIFWGIQYNYRWQEAPIVLLLNLPGIYNGVGIMNANPYEELTDHLRIFYKNPPKGKIVAVASYNMEHNYDGAHVTVIDSMNIRVTLNQWGTWWWYVGRGMKEYENDYYTVRHAGDGRSYILHLKQRPNGLVILYSQGMQWREVDMEKKEEQYGF